MIKKIEETGSLIIGGGVLLGIGIGFFFLPNVFVFVESFMSELGIGLIISSIISAKK